MSQRCRLCLSVSLLTVICPFLAFALPPCAYTAVESLSSQLTLQGNLRYEGSGLSTSSLGGDLTADYNRLYASSPSAYSLKATGDFSIGTAGPELTLDGSGDFKRFIEGDRFAVGALKLDYAQSDGLEVDLTGGVGIGRFRDVTPLAKAIQIQNTLIDEGILLAPFTNETLQELAQAIGRVGTTLSEQLTALEKTIVATGLLKENALSARGLLAMEDNLSASGEARLCGWDLQARFGGAVTGIPEPTISEAIVLQARYALAPDAVSQWTASAQWTSGFSPLSRYSITASLSYGRRVGQGFRLAATYRFTRDDHWSAATADYDSHDVSSTLAIQLTSGLSLTVNGKLTYDTRVGQLTSLLLVQLSYDVF
jgi:hypothetical protein